MVDQKKHILISDIGGTNCRFQIIDQDFNTIFQKVYKPTVDQVSTAQAIKKFMDEEEAKSFKIKDAVLAVCSPVIGNVVQDHHNLPVGFFSKEEDIKSQTGLQSITFLNDFVANGYGVLSMKNEEMEYIHDPEQPLLEDKVRLLMGPGTGFGFTFMTRPTEKDKYAVYPSEISMTHPNSFETDQHELFKLIKDTREDVKFTNTNMILSGNSMLAILKFIKTKKGIEKSPILEAMPIDKITSENIVKYAENEKDELCLATIEYFMIYLAKTLRNCCTTYLCYGGVYLCAGVVEGSMFWLKNPENKAKFLEAVFGNDMITWAIKRTPIRFIAAHDLGMRGCYQFGKQNGFFD